MNDIWLVLGPVSIGIAGWFVGLEIKRLRMQVDVLLQNQSKMAVQIARLESLIK
jgi:hypothetical protein